MFGYEDELQESIVTHREWLRKLIAMIEKVEAEFEPRLPGYMIPTFHRLTELSDEAKAFLIGSNDGSWYLKLIDHFNGPSVLAPEDQQSPPDPHSESPGMECR